MYNKAVSNVNKLRKIESSPYFTERLNEAQLEVERREATEKGIKEGIEQGIKEGIKEGIEKGAEKEREKWIGVVAELANKDAIIAEYKKRFGEN